MGDMGNWQCGIVGESLRVFEGTRRLPNLNVGLEGIDVVADKGHVANGGCDLLEICKTLCSTRKEKKERKDNTSLHTYIFTEVQVPRFIPQINANEDNNPNHFSIYQPKYIYN